MHGPTNPDELRAAADLAGIADVIAVEDGHALLRFVRLTKGKPRRHPDDPFPHDLPGTAAVDLASTDPEVFRPGLRVETHLVRGSIAFRGICLAWDDHTILGRPPTAPAPSVTEPSPGWRRHVVADPLRPGEAAASLVHPEDWRAEGFVAYIPGNGDANALVFARAQALDGTRACEIYPDEHFGGDTSAYLAVEDLPEDLWSSREMTVGGRLFGRVMMQGAVPGNHVFSLEKSVIPKYRGHLGDLHVYRPWRYWDQTRDMMDFLRIEPRDGLAYEYVEQEIAYSLGGVRFRETFMAIGYRRAARTVTPCPWFGLLALRSYRAPEGESGVRECLEVLRSFEPDPAWRERCARMHRQLVEGDHAPLRDLDRAMRAEEAREGAERAAYFAQPEPDEAPRPSGRRDASRARRKARGELYDPPAYHDPANPDRAYRDERFYRFLWTDGAGVFRGSDDPAFEPDQGDGPRWTRAMPIEEAEDA